MAIGCIAVSSKSQELEYATLPELLELGGSAFARGQFAPAAQAFNFIRHNYAEEPVWIDSDLPRRLLPIAGFSSLKAGLYDESVSAIESYLDEYATPDAEEAFARYTLALAQRAQGNNAKAIEAFRSLRQHTENASLKGLAAIQLARLESYDQAAALLEETIESGAAERVVAQARLSLTRLALENDQPDKARQALLESNWHGTAMPELATLSFLAFKLGDALVEQGRNGDALTAYRLVTPTPRLISEQKLKIAELENTLARNARRLSPEQSIWTDFYREILSSLASQLAALQSSEDYTLAIELRKARCFTALGRSLEAWLLLEKVSLANDSTLSPHAHRSWIGLTRSLKAWGASAAIAREYINRYPNHEDVDEVLYWIAQSLLEEGKMGEAARSFAEVATVSRDIDLQAAAHYFLGYCRAAMHDHPRAFTAFEQAASLAGDKPIAAQARLWIGILHFTEEQYELALAAFSEVKENAAWEILHAEAEYREAACFFAQDDLEATQQALNAWLELYPGHARQSEAYLLLGDVYSLEGNNSAAISAYENVDPEERELRYHAVSSIAQLLAQTGELDAALAAMSAFRVNEVPSPLAADFYLLWAYLLEQAGSSMIARERLSEALQRHGNELEADGAVHIVSALFQHDVAAMDTLARQSEALGEHTRAARIRLALASQYDSQGQKARAESQRFEMAAYPIAELPPECLVEIGLALARIRSIEAPTYLQRVLDLYSTSSYSSTARYGLAIAAAQAGETDLALAQLAAANASNTEPSRAGDILELEAELLFQSGEAARSRERYEELLAIRSLPSQRKAKTLFAIGETYLAENLPKPAYACFQRVFTLYRAEAEWVARSYLRGVEVLSQIDQYGDADALCQEFLAQTDLTTHAAYRQAESLKSALTEKVQSMQLETTDDPSI